MSDLPPLRTHAALKHGALLTMDGRRYTVNAADYTHVTELVARALTRGIRALWILGDAGAPLPGGTFTAPLDGWNVFVPQGMKPRAAIVRRDGEYEHVYIYWLDSFSPWPWRDLHDAGAVLDAVSAYAGALDTAPSISPAQTGLDLLQRTVTRQEWILPTPAPADLPHPFDLLWLAPFEPTRAPYLHEYDANAAYLAVAAGQTFGCGAPIEVRDEPPHLEKLYGYWHVTARAGVSAYRGVDLPAPWPSAQHRDTFQGWAYTPQVRAARDLGWDVTVTRGYVWPERHQLLRAWCERVWRAREQTTGPARDAIKATYTHTFGRMAHAPSGDELPWYYRPHWHGWIMAEMYRRQLALVDAVMRHTGRMPICVLTDAIVYASDHADPAALGWRHPTRGVISLMDRPQGLGGYKHAGTLADPDAIRALAQDARPGTCTPSEWTGRYNAALRQGVPV